MTDEVRLGPASVRILRVVRGLPRDGAQVARAIDDFAPDLVALSIGPEELEALALYDGGPAEPSNFEEEVYVAGLSAWETPVKPPPCFVEALRVSQARGIRIEGIDFDEEAYTDVYTACVSAVELILQGRTEARLTKRRFRATTPEAFVLEWDAEVNRAPGFARLQKEREAHMARRLHALAGAARRVLAVVELERAQGVLAGLRA